LSQIAIHYPSLFCGYLLIPRCSDEAGSPETLVQLQHGISPNRFARVDLPDAPRPMITTRFIFCSVLTGGRTTFKSGLRQA
jgi:hypothetical protein